ncbi:MAG: GFA family protein [Rhodospirillales bacterium]|nr:GFA family protein [Rhodospirillales bacterium]
MRADQRQLPADVLMNLTGGCLCGGVTYQLEFKPRDVADVCFCRECRKASGAAALPWVQVPPARFAITRGAAKGYASSPGARRWFCGDCGTPLYMTDAQGRSVGVTLGSLDNPEAIRPTTQGWMCERVSWQALDETLPAYEKAPPYDL